MVAGSRVSSNVIQASSCGSSVKKVGLSVPALFEPLPVSHLPMSNWPKQVTWLSLESVWEWTTQTYAHRKE